MSGKYRKVLKPVPVDDSIIYWSEAKPIRDLINQLIDLEIKGYTDIKLITVREQYEPEGLEGTFDYEEVAKLKVIDINDL